MHLVIIMTMFTFSGNTTVCITLRNEVGNSKGLQYAGFQRSIIFLKSNGLGISVVVFDKHRSIAKHMRENEKETKHYFDLWHLKKLIFTILLYESLLLL